MIQANELRIGNFAYLFLPLEKQAVEITGIMPDKIFVKGKYNGFALIEAMDPIPLTEEILSLCRFRHIENKSTNVDFWEIKRNRKDFNKPSISIYKNYTTVGNNTHTNHVNYLHQLQNLYFAIAGEELKITL